MRTFHIRLLLLRNLDSLEEFVPQSLFEPLPSHTPRPPLPDSSDAWLIKEKGGKASLAAPPIIKEKEIPIKDYRFGPIAVDWLDILSNPGKKKRKGPKMSYTSTPHSGSLKHPNGKERTSVNKSHQNATKASFTQSLTSGTTNLPQGIVQIFRDIHPTASEADENTSTISQDDDTTLAVLAVPSYMTPADFLTYVGPAEEGIAHLRLIRDTSPNRSIALIKFRDKDHAEEFAEAYNGRSFNSMEPEICHVVRILSIVVEPTDAATFATMPAFSRSFETPSSPITFTGAVYELPTCPVCLERMDSAVTGLVTVPCSHTFHCMCLSKWGDSRCPVCRYSQTLLTSHPPSSSSRQPFSTIPPSASDSSAALSTCASCSSITNLWICLICGNVGCGRYGLAHAHAHFEATMHLYALELETQRVWDYAGDGYVHRLIQNKTDGKLVELPSASSMTAVGGTDARGMGPGPADTLAAEKIEAIGIEYSYLLTSQLDSQRIFYEEQQGALEARIAEESSTQVAMQEKYQQLEREKIKIEKKAEKSMELARKLERELKEERAVSEGLMKNLDLLKVKVESSEKERKEFASKLSDMEDQLRDVMFFLEARDKIEGSGGVEEGGIGEAAGGSVSLPPPSSSKGRKKKGKK